MEVSENFKEVNANFDKFCDVKCIKINKTIQIGKNQILL